MSVSVLLDADEIIGETYSISVERGRSLESERFGPGGGTIRVHNLAANFNPYFLLVTDALLQANGDFLLQANGDKILLGSGNGTGAGSYGEIELGRKVTVKDGGVTTFTGYLEDLDFEYDAHGRADAILTVRDALGSLGATYMQEWDVDQQLTGARVSAVLDDEWVDFPTGAANRSIATGTQPLAADKIPFGTNALSYLQTVNDSEAGRLYVDADGKLTFADRYSVFGLTPSAAFNDAPTGGDLPFHGIDIRFGTELLHFRVTVRRKTPVLDNDETGEEYSETPEPVGRTATNEALAAEYASLGKRSLTVGDVLFNSDHHSLGLAQFMLNRFAQFKAVISGLTVKLGNLSTSQRATVCGLDIGDVVSVSWTPTGTTGAVSQVLAIEAVGYEVDRYEKNARVTFQLSDASDPGYFVVGTDAVNGSALLAP